MKLIKQRHLTSKLKPYMPDSKMTNFYCVNVVVLFLQCGILIHGCCSYPHFDSITEIQLLKENDTIIVMVFSAIEIFFSFGVSYIQTAKICARYLMDFNQNVYSE